MKPRVGLLGFKDTRDKSHSVPLLPPSPSNPAPYPNPFQPKIFTSLSLASALCNTQPFWLCVLLSPWFAFGLFVHSSSLGPLAPPSLTSFPLPVNTETYSIKTDQCAKTVGDTALNGTSVPPLLGSGNTVEEGVKRMGDLKNLGCEMKSPRR